MTDGSSGQATQARADQRGDPRIVPGGSARQRTHDSAGAGAGRALLQALIEACAHCGYRQMVAVIGDSANAASIGLHAACGFAQTGVLHDVGFKFGRWVDSVLMQRALGEGGTTGPGEARGIL